jgi:multiple sugar transport system ATP-binding protein
LAVVTIAGLGKHYDRGGEAAVKNVSLTVGDGEFMVLLGPSGCGKSSILRMIAGLEPISSGTVAIDGAVVNDVPAKNRDIAMVFQSYALYPHMSVYDNLAFGLRRRGFARDEIDRRVRGAAAKLDLTLFLTRKPHALSGGQRQRVALGRAIVRAPKVLLLDEPLSNLDAALRLNTRNELIRQQAELGTTTIYVTHDQIEAMTMGHRICIMQKGEVVQVGAPLEVYRRPANTFVARFLGGPPMNLIPAELELAGAGASVRLDPLRIGLDLASRPAGLKGGAVTLGIRPEDIYEAPPAEPGATAGALPVRVVAVEPLGAETLVVVRLAGSDTELIARVGRDSRFVAGTTSTIFLDLARIHLFDPATTAAITGFTVRPSTGASHGQL